MNLFSRMGAVFSAVSKGLAMASSMGGFEGAMAKRRLIAWKATEENINSLVANGGDLLRARARQIVRSNPYAANAANSQRDVIAKLVETGQKAEAQRLILAALEQQVGGAATAETQGLTGAAHRLSVAWGDMLKAIGQTETRRERRPK